MLTTHEASPVTHGQTIKIASFYGVLEKRRTASPGSVEQVSRGQAKQFLRRNDDLTLACPNRRCASIGNDDLSDLSFSSQNVVTDVSKAHLRRKERRRRDRVTGGTIWVAK